MEKTKTREKVEQDGRLEVLEGQEGVMENLHAGMFFVLFVFAETENRVRGWHWGWYMYVVRGSLPSLPPDR